MRMPQGGLKPNAVHTPRMNTKAGINDKWALGLRRPMAEYLDRVEAIAAGSRLLARNRSAPAAPLHWAHSPTSKGDAMCDFACTGGGAGTGLSLTCHAVFDKHTTWQGWNASDATAINAGVGGSAEGNRSGHSRSHGGSHGSGHGGGGHGGGGHGAGHSAGHAHARHGNETSGTKQPLGAVQATHAPLPLGVQPRRFTMTSESFLQWALWRKNISIVYEPSWMFCKFKDATNGTVRICVPRMRARQRCASLICTGGGIDCGCHQNSTCTYYDPRSRKNLTHWYCQNTGAVQLSVDGVLY